MEQYGVTSSWWVDRRFGQLGIIKVLEFVDSSGSFDRLVKVVPFVDHTVGEEVFARVFVCFWLGQVNCGNSFLCIGIDCPDYYPSLSGGMVVLVSSYLEVFCGVNIINLPA